MKQTRQCLFPYASRLSVCVRVYRESKRMGLRKFAQLIGVSAPTLCRIEQSKGCDVHTLVQIHQQTGISYNVLLGEDA